MKRNKSNNMPEMDWEAMGLEFDPDSGKALTGALDTKAQRKKSTVRQIQAAMALKRQEGGLIGLAIELMQATPPDAPRPAEEATGAATERAAPWNESTRCYLCITTLLEVHASSAVAAAWLEDVLVGEEVDAMLRWLKEASRTAALGRAVERARLLGVVRRGGRYERTESQQTALEQLRGLQRAVAAKAKAAARR